MTNQSVYGGLKEKAEFGGMAAWNLDQHKIKNYGDALSLLKRANEAGSSLEYEHVLEAIQKFLSEVENIG